MNRLSTRHVNVNPCIPHTRGDEPSIVASEEAPNLLVGRIPHTRGDEPPHKRELDTVPIVFPTHVGMNRPVSAAG